MEEYQVKSAVAMVVFNRYDTTIKVFEQIRKVKPKKLFVIADGPRKNVPQDVEKCKKVREIFDKIDWDCEVYKDYSDENLGCSKRPYTGFSWLFENVEEAIILEDDCLPNISFFKYCDELLEKYRYDERIMLISGTNQLKKWKKGNYSYHFSNFGGIWGWASWSRAWKYCDIDIKLWDDDVVKELLKEKLSNIQYITRKKIYDELCNNSNKSTAWDYQFGFARLIQSGLAISPSVNLITNIGDGAFMSCSQLFALYLPGSTVVTLDTTMAFEDTPMSRVQGGQFGSIYVPSELVDTYQYANNWSAFSERITAYN